MARKKLRVTQTGTELVPFTADEETAADQRKQKLIDAQPARAAEEIQRHRRGAYQQEADTLYFEEQAGEVSAGTWAAKRAEIKARFPKA